MNASPSLMAEPRPAPAGALPRLLAGVSGQAPIGLEEHLEVHGEVALARGRASHALVDEIERSGLRGHGGAGFPVARKMRAVADARGRPFVVVNATEGEPASLKDSTLLELAPHLVIDGGVLAAAAVGAREVIIGVCDSQPASFASMAAAIDERNRHAASRHTADVALVAVPPGYVSGQESALISFLNGGEAKPTFTPPMVFQQGIRRRPTLVNNAETLAHVALIARHGARWFRELGTDAQPGSALITLSGALAQPGVYEVEYGESLSALLAAAGGATSPLRAVLAGGYAGGWVDAAQIDELALSEEHLAPHGTTLGAGIVFLLGDSACPVAETARVTRWLAGESAGQCGPCIHGLDSLATTLESFAAGTVDPARGMRRIAQLAQLTERRGACAHPDGAVRFVASAARTFAEEFTDHAQHGPCDACARPALLPLPSGRDAPSARDTRSRAAGEARR